MKKFARRGTTRVAALLFRVTKRRPRQKNKVVFVRAEVGTRVSGATSSETLVDLQILQREMTRRNEPLRFLCARVNFARFLLPAAATTTLHPFIRVWKHHDVLPSD